MKEKLFLSHAITGIIVHAFTHASDFGHHNTDYVRGMFQFHNKDEITKENVAFLQIVLVCIW